MVERLVQAIQAWQEEKAAERPEAKPPRQPRALRAPRAAGTSRPISKYFQVNNTPGRHQGHNGHTHCLCTEFFTSFTSTGTKSRLNFLQLIRAPFDNPPLAELHASGRSPRRVTRPAPRRFAQRAVGRCQEDLRAGLSRRFGRRHRSTRTTDHNHNHVHILHQRQRPFRLHHGRGRQRRRRQIQPDTTSQRFMSLPPVFHLVWQ